MATDWLNTTRTIKRGQLIIYCAGFFLLGALLCAFLGGGS